MYGTGGSRLRRQHARPAQYLPAALGRDQQQDGRDQVLRFEGCDRGRGGRRSAGDSVALGHPTGTSARGGAVDEPRSRPVFPRCRGPHVFAHRRTLRFHGHRGVSDRSGRGREFA